MNAQKLIQTFLISAVALTSLSAIAAEKDLWRCRQRIGGVEMQDGALLVNVAQTDTGALSFDVRLQSVFFYGSDSLFKSNDVTETSGQGPMLPWIRFEVAGSSSVPQMDLEITFFPEPAIPRGVLRVSGSQHAVFACRQPLAEM